MDVNIQELKDLLTASCELLPGHCYIAAVDSERVSQQALIQIGEVLHGHDINIVIVYSRGPEAPLRIFEVTPEEKKNGK